MNARAYDVVVIGSGAGGGTVAEGLGPLARAGYRILVVEQGARLRDDEFTGKEAVLADGGQSFKETSAERQGVGL